MGCLHSIQMADWTLSTEADARAGGLLDIVIPDFVFNDHVRRCTMYELLNIPQTFTCKPHCHLFYIVRWRLRSREPE